MTQPAAIVARRGLFQLSLLVLSSLVLVAFHATASGALFGVALFVGFSAGWKSRDEPLGRALLTLSSVLVVLAAFFLFVFHDN